MAQLTVQRVPGAAGLEYTYTTSTTADKFKNDGRTLLFVKTLTAPTGNVVVVSVNCSHGRTKDITLAKVANKFYVIGPLDPALFNDANGDVNVTQSSATDTSYAAVGL